MRAERNGFVLNAASWGSIYNLRILLHRYYAYLNHWLPSFYYFCLPRVTRAQEFWYNARRFLSPWNAHLMPRGKKSQSATPNLSRAQEDSDVTAARPEKTVSVCLFYCI